MRQNNYAFIAGWGFSADMWVSLNSDINRSCCYDFLCPFDNLDHWVDCNQAQFSSRRTMVAWSFGALAAINLAYRYPNQVKELILLSSSPCFLAKRHWRGVSKKYAMAFYDSLMRNALATQKKFIYHASGTHNKALQKEIVEQAIIAKNSSTMAHWLKIFYALDYRDMISSLKIPITFYIPAQDTIWPVSIKQLKDLNQYIFCRECDVKGHAFLWRDPVFQRLMESIPCT